MLVKLDFMRFFLQENGSKSESIPENYFVEDIYLTNGLKNWRFN